MPNEKFLLFGLVIVATIFTILYRFLIVNIGARRICQTIPKYNLLNLLSYKKISILPNAANNLL